MPRNWQVYIVCDSGLVIAKTFTNQNIMLLNHGRYDATISKSAFIHCICHHSVLLAGFSPHLPATATVVYYVLPTEPCSHDDSCPSGQTCHTMDYYASNMCGVYNCTKLVHINGLQTFTMVSIQEEDNMHVTINMPVPIKVLPKFQDKSNHIYTFINVSNVRIKEVTINCISVSFEGKFIA